MGIGNPQLREGRPHGFTLIEVMVAVSILAILSATLSPMVIKQINDGRRARARSDSQTLGQAITVFNLDTGGWPVSSDGIDNDPGEISRLVGLPAAQVAPANIPGGQVGWSTLGAAAALEDHLIFNRDGDTNVLYPASASPPHPPGWNGPYLLSVPMDPWGNPYVCNVRHLKLSSVAGVPAQATDDHSVWCLSAGEDGAFNTVLADATAVDVPAGDDLGWPVQGRESRPPGGGGGGGCGLLGVEPILLLTALGFGRRRRSATPPSGSS